MKKNLLLALCLFVSAGLFAQISIEKGYAGAGLGFTKLTGDIAEGGSGGITAFVDGAVYLMPKVAVGVEGNFNLHGYQDADDNLKFRSANLYLAKGEYYFLDKNFSPFVGLGLGLSTIVRDEVVGFDQATGEEFTILEEKTKFNFAASPRLGFVAGGFHMEYIYNFAGKTPATEFDEGGQTYNFWTISLGYRYIFEL
ncbi:MAG: outer membrane beta-barrel protein [Saprospiraceae bacterium]